MLYGDTNDVIKDEELKKTKYFKYNSKIYDIDLDLLDLEKNGEGKLKSDQELSEEFLEEDFHIKNT